MYEILSLGDDFLSDDEVSDSEIHDPQQSIELSLITSSILARASKRWPQLAALALDIFATPVMLDEPERVFSVAGAAVSPPRRLLNSETIECLMCLKVWIPLTEASSLRCRRRQRPFPPLQRPPSLLSNLRQRQRVPLASLQSIDGHGHSHHPPLPPPI